MALVSALSRRVLSSDIVKEGVVEGETMRKKPVRFRHPEASLSACPREAARPADGFDNKTKEPHSFSL